MATSTVKVNDFVKHELVAKRVTAVDLGRELGLSSDASYKLLKREDWKISEMEKVGAYLGKNLFELFVPRESKEGELSAQLKETQEKLAALEQRFAFMEQENKFLKELVEMAKMKLKK